jgi:histone demethylase JARID1
MHQGAPKTWYGVPADFKDRFDEVIKSKYSSIFQKSPDILHHITLMLNPIELMKNHIPVYRVL